MSYILPSLFCMRQIDRKIVEIAPNGNVTSEFGDYRKDYIYDAAGRVTQIIVNKEEQNLVTKNYYDHAGNQVRVVGPEGREVQKVYHPRGWVLAEIDPMGRMIYHQLNGLGNEIGITDPRGIVKASEANFEGIEVEILGEAYRLNPEYTTQIQYDSLGRNIKATDLIGNTYEVYYDKVGNKREEIAA